MIKKQKNVSISFIVIGLIVMVIFGLYPETDFNGSILCGFGSALTVLGIIRLIRLHRLTSDPDKAADYEAANKDERVQYIAMKARAMVFYISVYVQLIGGLIAQFVFEQRLLCMVLCYSTCIQCLLFVALYRYYSGKY